MLKTEALVSNKQYYLTTKFNFYRPKCLGE